MNSKKLSQNKTVFYNILSTVLLQGLTFFTAPIFSRLLGTTNYGIVSVYNTWVSLVSIVFPLQVGATLGIARSHFDDDEYKKYQSSIMFLALLSYILFSILTLALINPLSSLLKLDKLVIIFILLGGFGAFAESFANSKFIFEFKADKNMYLSLVASIGGIALSMLLVLNMPASINYYGRIAGKAIVDFLLGVVILFIILKHGKTYHQKNYWRFCLELSIPLIFHSLSNLILSQSDRIMLQQMLNAGTVGIYSLAYNFGGIMSTIYNTLNNSWVPFYYDYLKNHEITELKVHTRNYCELFTILMIGFLMLFPEVYRVFADKTYWDGISLIPIFIAGFYMMFLYSFPVNYEFYNKTTKFTAIMTISAAVLNIILNYFMIQWWGAFGAAFASSISYGAEFLAHYFYAKSIKTEMSYPLNFTFFIPYLVILIAAYVIYYLAINIWMIRWGVAAIVGIFLLVRMYKRRSIF